jgi:hypothetical protein
MGPARLRADGRPVLEGLSGCPLVSVGPARGPNPIPAHRCAGPVAGRRHPTAEVPRYPRPPGPPPSITLCTRSAPRRPPGTDLVHKVDLCTHQNGAQIVEALQCKELLEVEPAPADRHRKLLSATNNRVTYWRERDAGDIAANCDWFAGPGFSGTFCDLADRVVARLNRAQGDPGQHRLPRRAVRGRRRGGRAAPRFWPGFGGGGRCVRRTAGLRPLRPGRRGTPARWPPRIGRD